MSVQGELPLESDELAEFQRLATESHFLFLLSDLLIVTRYCPSAVGDAAAGGHKNKPFKLIAAYPLSDLSDLGLGTRVTRQAVRKERERHSLAAARALRLDQPMRRLVTCARQHCTARGHDARAAGDVVQRSEGRPHWAADRVGR